MIISKFDFNQKPEPIMKKMIIPFAVFALVSVTGCKKSENNSNLTVEESVNENVTNVNGETDSTFSSEKKVQDGKSSYEEKQYRYVAEDGSNAQVTTVDSDEENYIMVKSNNYTLRGAKKESTATGAVYENQGVVIKLDGDLLTITQDDKVIELKKAGGQ